MNRATCVFAIVVSFGVEFAQAAVVDGPPPLPMAGYPIAERSALRFEPRHLVQTGHIVAGPGGPIGDTFFLPLSAGVSMISIPLRTQSETLGDLLPDLPAGSRIWTWDRTLQRFVEGFDRPLPLGHGAVLYLPVPAVIMVRGERNLSTRIVTDLGRGWNLIGVPYESSLPRAHQTVHVDFERVPLDEAIEEKDIGDLIYTLGTDGYQTVGLEDSFEPMRAYWIFSGDAEALDLNAPLLQAGSETLEWWFAKQVGGAAVSWSVGQLLNLAVAAPDRDQEILNRIDGIGREINGIHLTQRAILASLADLQQRTREDTSKIVATVLAQQIAAVRTELDVRYQSAAYNPDNPSSTPCAAGECLRWFLKAAQTDPRSITRTQANQFAYKVVYVWEFRKHLATVYTAMVGGQDQVTDPGLIGAYGEWVETATSKGSPEDRQRQMIVYFNSLIGLQIQCMTLLTNAYTHLASLSPQEWSTLSNGTQPRIDEAENFRKGEYTDRLRDEYARLQQVIENNAIRKLQIPMQLPESPDAPAVVLPSDAQVSFQMLDFVLAAASENPMRQGLRIRLLVNPDLDNLELNLWVRRCDNKQNGCSGNSEFNVPVPPLSQWRTMRGPKDYDSWGWDPQGGMAIAGPGRQFRFTRDWKMTTVFVPLTEAGGYRVALRKVAPGWENRLEDVSVAFFDNGYRRTDQRPANLFGSVTLGNRPTAKTMFNPAPGCTNPPSRDVARGIVRNSCGAQTEFTDNCRTQQIRNCNGLSAETLTMIPFKYVGAEPVQGRFWAWADGLVEGNQADCIQGNDHSVYMLELGDLTKRLFAYSINKPMLAVPAEWHRNIQYTLTIRNVVASSRSYCNGSVTYKGVLMTSP